MLPGHAFYGYKDRTEAANILAEKLKKYKGQNGIVLAIPRGGVPIGVIVASALGFDFDLALSKKIGHPLQKEYAIGAVSLTDSFIDDHPDVPESYIAEEERKIRIRLGEMYSRFMGNKKPLEIIGKIVIIIDDGIATGHTVLSTLMMIKKQSPKKTIIAVPVASQSAIEKLSLEADEIVCPLVPEFFLGVGGFYDNFEQVSDDEVKRYIDNFQNNEQKS